MGNKKNKKKLSSLKIRRIKKKARLSDEGRKTTECGLTSTSNGEVVTTPENSQLSDEARLSTGCEFINSTNTAVITMPENSESTKQSDSDNLIIEAEELDDNQFHLVTGRRIVDINYIFRELQDKGRHNNLFNCNSSNFVLVGEKRNGLISQFKFECAMCKEICIISNEKKEDADQLNLNLAAITGVIGIGIGYSQFEELFSAINIPVFSSKYYTQLQNEVYAKWEDTAVASMEAAAQKEKDFALAEGRTKSGYPVIDVYVDAAWCARSYGSNYKASSGVAAIIGRKTGQILYVGVKNKYCIICARAENKNLVPKEHLCFKNFQGSSCSMEAEILVEGFKSSISMYGLLYGRMIGDGDASTYAKILNADPYKVQNVTVEKIECKNHILRNFCKKLRGICSETKYTLIHRKTLTNVKIMTMRKAIVKSIKYHNTSENPKNVAIGVLHNDIINSVSHAYGNHQMCESYYCQKEKNDGDGLKNIQSSTFLFRINAIVSNVAAKARSLIEDVDTNKVECFNSVIAKFVGGKRINFSSKRGYQGRSSAAVVSFNTKCPISSVQESFLNKAPGGKVAEVERRRTLKRKFNSEHPVKKQRRLNEAIQKQHDYGHGTTAPDMPPEELETAKKQYMNQLESLTADRHAIESSTVLQRESSDWLEIRKKKITASNFGPICRRKETLDTAPLVKNILYKKNLADIASVAHGIENEKQALQKLEQQENITISACGLFIDQNYSFIGASPDGLVGNDTVVEVKCPIVAAKLGLSQAIEQNKIKILKYCKKDKTVSINKTSDWYFQVQGQLHITNRKKCIFGIWESENKPMYIIQIEKDDNLWNKMESRIVKFYTKCLLPEIIDSRRARGMPIRNICLKDDEDDNDKENVSTIDSQPNSKQVLSDDDHNVQPVQGDQNVQPVLQTRQLNFEAF